METCGHLQNSHRKSSEAQGNEAARGPGDIGKDGDRKIRNWQIS